ncbi:MAG TPA: hypothetical protein VFI46_10515 [Jiangellaceae bacterium]|nr:hypothetical protein [Jiangellaceae bacterium]
MFGAWESPEIATFWIAVAAVFASGWSVWYTRAAHRREERRDSERARPPVVARFDKWLSEPDVALFALENRGAVYFDRAGPVKVVTGDPEFVGFAENESTILGFGSATSVASNPASH